MHDNRKACLQPGAWKDLVSRLPGVLNAEFSVEGEAVREVHILADQSRSPKQIVRDVQSAMAARFQLELDHRVISVAQISELSIPPKKRLICHRMELSTGRDGISAAVTLELDGVHRRGEADSPHNACDRHRCVAQASVSAINAFLTPACRFSLSDWKQVPLGEHSIVLTGLRLTAGGKTEYLVGACPQGEDPNLSVVLSALDAVNRRLSTLPVERGGPDPADL